MCFLSLGTGGEFCVGLSLVHHGSSDYLKQTVNWKFVKMSSNIIIKFSEEYTLYSHVKGVADETELPSSTDPPTFC